jgi:hypothetical protein
MRPHQHDRRLGCTDGVFKCRTPAQARRKVAAIKERLQTLRAQHRIDVRRVAPVRTRVAHKYVVSLFATVITADQICVNNSSPSQVPYGSSRFAASWPNHCGTLAGLVLPLISARENRPSATCTPSCRYASNCSSSKN